MKDTYSVEITADFIIDNDAEKATYEDELGKITVDFETLLAPAVGFGHGIEHVVTSNAKIRELFTALLEFAEARGVSRHPESTLTARLEAAAFGGGK